MSLKSRVLALCLSSACLGLACNQQPKVAPADGVTPGAGGGGGPARGGSGGSLEGGNTGTGGGGGGIILPDASTAGATGTGGSSVDADFGDSAACGLENFKLERVPPEIMLVLDRSSSMNEPVVGGMPGATLWSDALAAVDDVLKTTQMQVRWGLKLFPLPTGCQVADGAEVVVSPNNHMPMMDKIRLHSTNTTGAGNMGGTPTDLAMSKAVAYLNSVAATSKNPKYVVLATDGEPTCAAGQSAAQFAARPAALDAIRAAVTAGYKTYVIGIAIDPQGIAVLNDMAIAGGVPRNDPSTKFYPAANKADLSQALNLIAGQISSCVFPLSKSPPDSMQVRVTVDGQRVPPNPTEGWSFTSAANTAIQLNGSYCDKLKGSSAADVAIVFGCPSNPVN